MRPIRVIRLIIRLMLLVLTLSMSVVSYLGGLSAINILGNTDNIVVPNGDIESNLNMTMTTNDSSSLYFKLPFKIVNDGYFDLEDLELKISVSVVFDWINKTTPGENDTIEKTVFEKEINFGTIRSGNTLKDKYEAKGDDFDLSDLPSNTSIDYTKDPPVEYLIDLVISAKYSLGLIAFRVEIHDLKLEDFASI